MFPRGYGEAMASIITDPQEAVQTVSLIDTLDGEWFKLPTRAMVECGPAAQCLGGLLKITNKETYTSAKKIAAAVREPLSTTRRHLQELDAKGYIRNLGRNGRRTCTVRVLQKARDAARDYGLLPWWAAANIRTLARKGSGARSGGRLPWGSKAVLSIVLTRLATMRRVVHEANGKADLDSDDLWGSIANLGGDERFRFSLAYLHEQTGLRKGAIIEAKRWLNTYGLIDWCRTEGLHGGDGRDSLTPSETFRVLVTPAGEGTVWLDFKK